MSDWQHCLELWLSCGVAQPSAEARAALRYWVDGAEQAGWRGPVELGRALLDARQPVARRPDALLDLLAWQQAAQRCRDAASLAE